MRTESGIKLIGRKVRIMDRKSMWYGNWGTVVGYDGQHYHIVINEDSNTIPCFDRNEFWVMRGQR